MMESTHSGEGHDLCAFRGAQRDRPPLRCIFAETEVGAILVVVGDVVPNESNSVAVAEHDDMIEQLSPTATYPSLGYRVGPGCRMHPMRRLKTEASESPTSSTRCSGASSS